MVVCERFEGEKTFRANVFRTKISKMHFLFKVSNSLVAKLKKRFKTILVGKKLKGESVVLPPVRESASNLFY
jgi:hypothetical protein